MYHTVQLKLRQFFYKTNYLWSGKDFVSPIATYYKSINPKFPNNWRDIGRAITHEYVGCHFSWCMSVDEMMHKLDTYSHPRYRFCANSELLQNAIDNKTYPFDTTTTFNILELDTQDSILPMSLRRL